MVGEEVTKLWKLIVAEQHLTFVQRWDNGKPIHAPRWPREARWLANECLRLTGESALYKAALLDLLCNVQMSDEKRELIQSVLNAKVEV